MDLEAFMYRLISHPLLVKHTKEVTAAVEKFKWTAAMNVLLPLLHLDSARGDIAHFLNSCLKEVCALKESKVLIEALTKHLTNLQSQTWRLVRSFKLSDPEVAKSHDCLIRHPALGGELPQWSAQWSSREAWFNSPRYEGAHSFSF